MCGRQREKLSTILHFLRDTSSKRCCVMIKWLSKVLGKQFDRKIEKRRRKHALSSMLWWKVSLSEYYLLLHEARLKRKNEYSKHFMYVLPSILIARLSSFSAIIHLKAVRNTR